MSLTPNLPDFTVLSLGTARYPSPLAIASNFDGKGDFVSDESRVLYQSDWQELRRFLDEQREPPMLEMAGPRERIFFRPTDVRAAIVTAGGLCPGINDVLANWANR